MTKAFTDSTVLHNGVKMPWLGFGVWQISEGASVVDAVRSAIETGYRSIDTAAAYRNEAGVGQAIQESGIAREELFVTTKVWNADQGYDSTLAAFEQSRKLLGLEYLDLYLIHWPTKGKYKDTWRAIEKIYADGLARAIGVCNFQTHHLEDLKADAKVIPMVNQVEYHPLLAQQPLRQYCRENNIQLEAWSPLMQGNLDQPVLAEIAARYGKSAAQIVLRWDLQNEVVTIPKSTTPSRIRENTEIFDFELSAEDMARITALDAGRRFGPDPDNFNF
ncbi:diketogulonate reductase-like aldo/keto reductase [Paenibacillus phyllosphaerae]|uniref:Diketogulonate reductase-like aldo/keto reductase n=1 Tax=Paenibacillus phyllosphaerae TaxID=274593 RepID=A0A7W5B518_9BACL|nr:aldo/keto reductase [Paenibacillus phyllosphaerae]MBB3114392.1 diketogulonate reductase-like aldo/keto reductase [Paenibacillus phyllosphaerae]